MYKIEKRALADAPCITHDDVMTMTEAAATIGISTQAIANHLDRGTLTTVIDENTMTAYGNPRRLVLRHEIEGMKRERAGGKHEARYEDVVAA